MFKKYNSIENTYREKEITQVYLHGYDKEEYVVQEKVHGANFSIITDGIKITAAKRSGIITANENFNNYQHVLKTYSKAIKELFSLVKEAHPHTISITVYGEIFGGSYDHKEVKRIKEMVRIQKGVFYSPANNFYAFDICINQEEYIDVDTANAFFEKVGLFYAKTIFKGSFKDCTAHPNDFNSKIAIWLGLPEIENNICEGVIIKPVKTKLFKNGNRVIFKNKNEKWSERTKGEKKEIKTTIPFSENEKDIIGKLLSYVNENRLLNVQSKLGDFTPKQTGKVIGLVSQDAFIDFKKDYETLWNTIEKERQKLITKVLNKEVITLVKKELLFK